LLVMFFILLLQAHRPTFHMPDADGGVDGVNRVVDHISICRMMSGRCNILKLKFAS
jgi:hypothetical protein